MTAAFGFILAGGLILLAGVRNRSITEILQGITSANEPTPQPTSAAASTKAAPPAPGGKGGNRALGYSLMQQKYPHWAADPHQWQCLEKLWTQESDWQDKTNPTSGARGIPQDITGNDHGGVRGQIIWGLDYIHGRYGSPCAAWAHEQANNWY